jgi:hypothetical protein
MTGHGNVVFTNQEADNLEKVFISWWLPYTYQIIMAWINLLEAELKKVFP